MVHARFPALFVAHMYLLSDLIGSLDFLIFWILTWFWLYDTHN